MYSWTIDNERSLRNHLQLGVDAIITNQPEKLANLIQTEFHDTLQLKNWEQIKSSDQKLINQLAKLGFLVFLPNIYKRGESMLVCKKCSKPSDCHGDLKCSELLNQ